MPSYVALSAAWNEHHTDLSPLRSRNSPISGVSALPLVKSWNGVKCLRSFFTNWSNSYNFV